MYKLFLNSILFNYMVENIDNEKIKEVILNKKEEQEDKIYFEIDVDNKIDLMDYIEDLQLEIGYDNEDYLNDDGKKLQEIYDEIHKQSN